ncbi:hypothetical protein JXA02_08890 [candidate division KSB1 bacterium]|nr:hypothetical protein [candidate division KSB1 bacterium]RQW04951.1 MAG: hypothetical protein EH222_10475 [candidate division KSB1 bacterium]
MASLLDSIRDGLELVVDKTEEYSKIGKLKVDIISIKRKIEKQFTELGGRTFDLLTGDDAKSLQKDDKVATLIRDIQAFEQELKEKEADIERVKQDKGKERLDRQEARKQQSEVNDMTKDKDMQDDKKNS